MNGHLDKLLRTLPQTGSVRWIGVRPARGQPMELVEAVEARPGKGLVGDRYAGSSGKREVTLLQWEHLPVIASLLGRDEVMPATLRRNIGVAGIICLPCAIGSSPSAAHCCAVRVFVSRARRWKPHWGPAVITPCAATAALPRK